VRRLASGELRYRSRDLTGIADSHALYNGLADNRLDFATDSGLEGRYTSKGDVKPFALRFGESWLSMFVGMLNHVGQETRWAALLKGDASVTITLPHNSSLVRVNGLLGPNHGIVHMRVDPPPPASNTEGTLALSTNRPWVIASTLLHLPLHPAVRYDLLVWTEAATAGDGVYLNTTTVVPYDDRSVTSPPNLLTHSPRTYEWGDISDRNANTHPTAAEGELTAEGLANGSWQTGPGCPRSELSSEAL
jgi:hypothetical protein